MAGLGAAVLLAAIPQLVRADAASPWGEMQPTLGSAANLSAIDAERSVVSFRIEGQPFGLRLQADVDAERDAEIRDLHERTENASIQKGGFRRSMAVSPVGSSRT